MSKSKKIKTYKGHSYFPSFPDARDYAVKHNLPTDRIIGFERGWAIQKEVSGTYYNVEKKAWEGETEAKEKRQVIKNHILRLFDRGRDEATLPRYVVIQNIERIAVIKNDTDLYTEMVLLRGENKALMELADEGLISKRSLKRGNVRLTQSGRKAIKRI